MADPSDLEKQHGRQGPPDESPNPPPPSRPPTTPGNVDEGLAAWANLVHGNLGMQSGVEIVGMTGGSVRFKFRGQEFMVTIQRSG